MASGIESLKVLSHMQAASASDDAADAANKGRDLLIEQKNVRARQQAFERAVGDKVLTEKEYADLNAMLGEVGMSKDGVDYTNSGVLGHYSGGAGTWTASLDAGSEDKTARDNANKVENMRKNFDGKLKEIESQERLDNFGIQELMSRYNQSEQLAASIEKKEGDTQNAVISKIG
ncbi:MAG: hypothetical protein IPG45_30575 [Deltaproteobacteria bacterium]|nr:hypothetical protein [Deltaproteobacteria bacterium]